MYIASINLPKSALNGQYYTYCNVQEYKYMIACTIAFTKEETKNE